MIHTMFGTHGIRLPAPTGPTRAAFAAEIGLRNPVPVPAAPEPVAAPDVQPCEANTPQRNPPRGRAQLRLLHTLAHTHDAMDCNHLHDACPAEAANRDWIYEGLRTLEAAGLVARFGRSKNGATLWRPTTAGLAHSVALRQTIGTIADRDIIAAVHRINRVVSQAQKWWPTDATTPEGQPATKGSLRSMFFGPRASTIPLAVFGLRLERLVESGDLIARTLARHDGVAGLYWVNGGQS